MAQEMEDTHNHRRLLHSRRRRQTPPSRLGLRHAGGEIVEVQGGHIVRPTGRKDQHSKVCTAKGPRDRRLRLSAHTAIQFYDVQDRLGYDRPSKAVDWLIAKAKAAIDKLAELPPWKPTSRSNPEAEICEEKEETAQFDAIALMGESSSNFLQPAMASDAIADTIKSFSPVGVAVEGGSSAAVQLQSQDLRLSLQSFQDPILFHHHQQQQQPHHHGANQQNEQLIFSGVGYDPPSAADISRFQRMIVWSDGGDASSVGGGGGGGFEFNSPPPPALSSQNNQFVSQRGPLQSSNTQSIRAWIDPYSISDHHQNLPIYHSSILGIGFPGFRIPARLQGGEVEHDGDSDKPPSSASSDSRH